MNSSQKPRIAVLIPAYNAEKIILPALESLRANAEPHDVYIVDDGSFEELQKFVPPAPNLTIIRAEYNLGITGALNFGIKYILQRDYDFIARFDTDDKSAADRLARQREFLDLHPDIVMVGTWARVVSGAGEAMFYLNHPTDHDAIVKSLYYNSTFVHPSLMIRTSVLREVGSYDPIYNGAEDYELVRRIARYGKVANIPAYLIDYTYSPEGISLSKRRLQLRMRLKVQWAYRELGKLDFWAGFFKTLVLWYLPTDFISSMKKRLGAYSHR